MLYLMAIICPPLAVLLCGKPFQALLNVPLVLLGWLPGLLHAAWVVHDHKARSRQEELIRALGGQPKPRSFRLS